jgi:hypothetical protein
VHAEQAHRGGRPWRDEPELGHHAQVVAHGDVIGEAAVGQAEQMELARAHETAPPWGKIYAQRSGRARIRRDLGLTPSGLPSCWPRWPFGPFRHALSI